MPDIEVPVSFFVLQCCYDYKCIYTYILLLYFSARKCQKAVFVSYNLPSDSEVLPLVENQLFEEISLHPDKF